MAATADVDTAEERRMETMEGDRKKEKKKKKNVKKRFCGREKKKTSFTCVFMMCLPYIYIYIYTCTTSVLSVRYAYAGRRRDAVRRKFF